MGTLSFPNLAKNLLKKVRKTTAPYIDNSSCRPSTPVALPLFIFRKTVLPSKRLMSSTLISRSKIGNPDGGSMRFVGGGKFSAPLNYPLRLLSIFSFHVSSSPILFSTAHVCFRKSVVISLLIWYTVLLSPLPLFLTSNVCHSI